MRNRKVIYNVQHMRLFTVIIAWNNHEDRSFIHDYAEKWLMISEWCHKLIYRYIFYDIKAGPLIDRRNPWKKYRSYQESKVSRIFRTRYIRFISISTHFLLHSGRIKPIYEYFILCKARARVPARPSSKEILSFYVTVRALRLIYAENYYFDVSGRPWFFIRLYSSLRFFPTGPINHVGEIKIWPTKKRRKKLCWEKGSMVTGNWNTLLSLFFQAPVYLADFVS